MSKEQLLEDPTGLLRETRNNFSIVNDSESLKNVAKNLEELQRTVEEKLMRKEDEAKQLDLAVRKTQNRLEVLRRARNGTGDNTDALSDADGADQLSQELELLEQRLVGLRRQVDEGLKELVAIETVREGSPELLPEKDAVDRGHKTDILKIQVYRSLGIALDLSNRNALINKTGTLDVVPLDDASDDFFRTKYLWDRI
ncbi:LADA_0G09538g1_1 [Lachancea dasiensis]|uniref:Kinetochore protein Spc24 n=1 Tax=Lachancea dasiensis TaxID=1072105 RepID=A0A1G4JUH9_9SACH|nr:LADA_0G09538g1_1 [Lachancea dasiensis]